ncbi:MAG TPA: hypothetical protein VF658_18920 [Pyrinomonadaceae bacterium]|jgi:hypothetical protein
MKKGKESAPPDSLLVIKMLERLNSPVKAESAARHIAELLAAHGEWLYVESETRSSALRRSECDARIIHGRLIFSCWSDAGARSWRVTSWEWTGEKLLLEATRRMGAESCKLELIPRASASVPLTEIGATRKERCLQLAQLACAQLTSAKIERAGLSAGARRGQPGRYARILLRHGNKRIAVTGPVTHADARDRDAFLSSSLLWFARTRERASGAVIQQLWLIVTPELIEPMARQLALLRDDLRRSIKLYEIDDGWQTITLARTLERAQLWTEAPPRFRPSAKDTKPSDWARRLLELAPDAIDLVRARNGETLRFHGLAFARVRRLMNTERAWLGIEGERRRLLDESNWSECVELVKELSKHRSASATDHRHAFYKSAPEAWLESLLRRDITRLDPGLRIAPLHAQFRTSHDARAATRPVDLLALRQDGRLVVIELKVTEDREHVLQGADYWRRIEIYRRAGHINRARLFGEAVIADEPPLVYLVAPLLRFHRSFQTLAHSIAPEIEIYRFDINEDWRAGVCTVRRERVT